MWLIILISSLIGGWLGRMDGGAPPKIPNIIERLLCLSPFVIVAALLYGDWVYAAFLAAIPNTKKDKNESNGRFLWLASLLGIFGISTGHGQYFMARMLKQIKPERVDFILTWFFGKDYRTTLPEDFYATPSEYRRYMLTYYDGLYWRNVAGMFLTGLLVGLPASIVAYIHGDILIGSLFLLTGPIKSVSYMLGWHFKDLFKLKHLEKDTEKAEFLNGFLRTLLCGVIWMTM